VGQWITRLGFQQKAGSPWWPWVDMVTQAYGSCFYVCQHKLSTVKNCPYPTTFCGGNCHETVHLVKACLKWTRNNLWVLNLQCRVAPTTAKIMTSKLIWIRQEEARWSSSGYPAGGLTLVWHWSHVAEKGLKSANTNMGTIKEGGSLCTDKPAFCDQLFVCWGREYWGLTSKPPTC
jgi:hypothetical protein